jgi:ketopantoate reductase
MHSVAREVLAVAAARGVIPEPFDEWSPAGYAPGRPEADADAATDRLVAWLATMPKDRSGIWRDIAVRHRPVEVHHHYAPVLREARERGVPTPLLSAVLARLAEIESGRVAMSELHLKELA